VNDLDACALVEEDVSTLVARVAARRGWRADIVVASVLRSTE
jgi:hypothetical protein